MNEQDLGSFALADYRNRIHRNDGRETSRLAVAPLRAKSGGSGSGSGTCSDLRCAKPAYVGSVSQVHGQRLWLSAAEIATAVTDRAPHRTVRLANRCDLANRGEQIAACLFAAATNLSADTAVVMVGRVAIALLGASTTCDNACLDRAAYDAEVGLGLTGHDAAGRDAHVGAVKIEPYAPHQLGQVGLAEAGVGAARARGGAVEALVNAAQEEGAIKADGPRMPLDDFSNRHAPSVPRWH
jgi:hypothetical protein